MFIGRRILMGSDLIDPNLSLKAIDQLITRREEEIKLLRARLEGLKRKEEELRAEVITFDALYGLEAVVELPDSKSSPTSILLAKVESILRNAGRRMSSRMILEEINEAGLHVSGKDPSSNLAAKLTHAANASDRFRSFGRAEGWGLLEWGDSEPGKPKDGLPKVPNALPPVRGSLPPPESI